MTKRKFEKGQEVRFLTGAEERWGRVTSYYNNIIRLVDDFGNRYTNAKNQLGRRININSVRRMKKGVFVFDTHLDKSLYSNRQTADLWYRFCQSANWSFGYERIHSIADLKYFLEKRKISEPVLLFSGHGSKKGGWQLTNNEVLDKKASLKIQQANKHKILLFSACGMGSDSTTCEHLRQTLEARGVIAYTKEVYDDQCFITETLLLKLIFAGYSLHDAVEEVKKSLDPLKNLYLPRIKEFPLVCF